MKYKAKIFPLLLTSLFLVSCSDQQQINAWETNENCKLHTEPCTTSVNQQQVTISIKPNDPIPIAQMLSFNVETAGIDIQSMQLDIAGVNMYMGFNRVKLSPTSENNFEGNTMFAFCTTSKMEWLITVIIQPVKGEQIHVPFKIVTKQ